MIRSIRRVAILGGDRVPFARAGGPYAGISNQRMLGAALDGLIDRFSLDGALVGEFAAGAVLGSRLDHRTPAYDVQQACATGMEAIALTANKIALGAMRTCGQARRPPGWPG
jgi:acetyl-CoA C-acetyltransferase